MMRDYLHIILIAALTLLSCDEKFVIVNCNDCTPEEPVDVVLEITLDQKETSSIFISVYDGNIEDKILLKSFSTTAEETEARVKVNRKYTLTAQYYENGGNSCIVVNTAYPRVRYEMNQCEEPCYYVSDKKVKLKLKYKYF